MRFTRNAYVVETSDNAINAWRGGIIDTGRWSATVHSDSQCFSGNLRTVFSLECRSVTLRSSSSECCLANVGSLLLVRGGSYVR